MNLLKPTVQNELFGNEKKTHSYNNRGTRVPSIKDKPSKMKSRGTHVDLMKLYFVVISFQAYMKIIVI